MVILEISNENYGALMEFVECIMSKTSKIKQMLKGDESEEETEHKVHVMKNY